MATRADTELSMPLVWVVPAEPASVGLVRRMLSASLASTRRARLDDLLLATSELVTNAIVHGEGAVAITVWPGPVVFRVEVSDNGEATPQPRQDHQEDDETGRGLVIVAALATRWGVWPKRHGPGKTVWFEMGESAGELRGPARQGGPGLGVSPRRAHSGAG